MWWECKNIKIKTYWIICVTKNGSFILCLRKEKETCMGAHKNAAQRLLSQQRINCLLWIEECLLPATTWNPSQKVQQALVSLHSMNLQEYFSLSASTSLLCKWGGSSLSHHVVFGFPRKSMSNLTTAQNGAHNDKVKRATKSTPVLKN